MFAMFLRPTFAVDVVTVSVALLGGLSLKHTILSTVADITGCTTLQHRTMPSTTVALSVSTPRQTPAT